MTKILLIVLMLFANICLGQMSHEYAQNQTVFLFGDRVKLRKLPTLEAETLQLLPVGAPLKIKQRTNEMYTYKGVSSPWYLVEYKGQEGYVVGGLISLQKHKSFVETNTFFVYNLSKNTNAHLNAVNIRCVKNGNIESEITIQLFGNGGFEIEHFDNKGLAHVDDIIVIDNYSEACGIDGGKSYVISNDNGLIHMANTSEIGDGGMLHHDSKFTFPADEGGQKGVIIYYQEKGEMKDEATNWYITTSQERNLIWNGIKLLPDDYDKE